MNGVRITAHEAPSAFGQSTVTIAATFTNHPTLMGQAAMNRVLDLIAERYVNDHYDELVSAMKPADVLALVQAKVAERLLAALTQSNKPTERQRRGKYFGFTEKPLMVSWDEFFREGGTL